MCGIVGRVNADRQSRVEIAQLRAATELLAHRGPDGEGVFLEGNVGLGHRRLAVVDLVSGAQPLSNEDGSIWVTFNGEIYNHLNLRSELEAAGHRFATRADTEVLVHGYEEWGDALPSRLRGMFAFAIWDRRRRRLLMVRDRLGIKPLYWTRAGGDLLFASEIKALFAFSGVHRALNAARVPEYLALRYVPGPYTLFEGIERLQPGHALSFQDGELRTWRFWDVPFAAPLRGPEQRTEKEESERFTSLLLESVRMRLMGDVPVGLFLSGGIDSTTVAWAMKQADPSALKSFSIGFEGYSEEEVGFARLAARAIGTEHRQVMISSAVFRDSLEDLAWHLDEPVSDGACIPLMHLAKRAWEEVVIVLSGEGADELLAGYGIYGKMLAIERAQALGGRSFEAIVALAMNRVAGPKVRKYLRISRQPIEQTYFGVGRAFGDELLAQAFGPSALRGLVARFAPYWRATEGEPVLHRLLYNDTKVWLPDDLLIKADKMTMAWAVELRVPFLDHVLLESVWRLPPSLKLRWGVGKSLLRSSMRDRIPASILRRPKRGFPVPLRQWLQGPLHDACRDELLAGGSAVRGIVGGALLLKLLEEHRTGRVDRTEELYALWLYEVWHRAFLSSRAIAPRSGLRLQRRKIPSPLDPGIPLQALAS
jgi:asparagine synthase (glutamine-hydrolysing)